VWTAKGGGMDRPVYVVLAAGASRRMGFDKAVTPLQGRSPLERVLAALEERDCVVVVPSRLAEAVTTLAPAVRLAINDEPERGMTRSLSLGLESVPRDRDFGVLPADMPVMSAATIAATEVMLQNGADVAYPVDADGVPGHPVLFAARTRPIVEALPQGDTLRYARDAPELRRATWVCADLSAFLDVDDPADWARDLP
jgi:molybdenum cofactor cytidylyltransferase